MTKSIRVLVALKEHAMPNQIASISSTTIVMAKNLTYAHLGLHYVVMTTTVSTKKGVEHVMEGQNSKCKNVVAGAILAGWAKEIVVVILSVPEISNAG